MSKYPVAISSTNRPPAANSWVWRPAETQPHVFVGGPANVSAPQQEYFIVVSSNAAPIISDTSHHFVQASSPEEAMAKLGREYNHPAGMYAARVYNNANDYHKNANSYVAELMSPRAHQTWG